MYQYQAMIQRIVNSGTYDLIIDFGFHIHATIRVHLGQFRPPETFAPSCDAEREHGIECSQYIKKLMSPHTKVVVKTQKTNEYGLWVADITINGCDLAELLTINGFQKRESYE